jgi:RND family efflux transporter MFP subunit
MHKIIAMIPAIASCALSLVFAAGSADADPGYDCFIEPKMVVKLGSQATGVLERVLVDRGDMVKSGGVVATLESTIEAKNADIAHVRAKNDTEVRLAEAAATFDESRFSRRSTLWKSKTIADETMEKSEMDVRMRRLEVERAKVALELARLDAGRMQALLELRTIKSPIDGVIVSRKMSPGEFVRDESQIVEIAQINPLHVNVFLPVGMFNRIQVGMLGIVRPEAPIGGEHRPRVTVKDPVVDAASSTFLVRLELPNAERRIPSGIRCKISFGDE